MILASFAILIGLAVLIWSANRFVDGAATVARHLRIPPLLIGMVVVGFGTSAPELAVSVIAAVQHNAGIALGNAFGSNITNIALILGLSAAISPITVHSSVLRKELPILVAATTIVAVQLLDGEISRLDAALLLAFFALVLGWTIWQGIRKRDDIYVLEAGHEAESHTMPFRRSIIWIMLGLLLLVASSRLLVWGALAIARSLQISDLIVGLTIVAFGTSLPELASSIAAARKKQDDLALGNILGSNLFNTLAVVGLAGVVAPLPADPIMLRRDMLYMGVLTIALFAIGYGFRRHGRINRWEGWLLLVSYVAYTVLLVTY